MRKAWGVLFGLALAWIAAQLHRGQPLGWDEVEFFRATKWTGEGLVPFRDFWEHHTPLQWLVFAPVGRLFAGGPGAASVVVLRWAQALAWIAILFLTMRLTRGPSRWWALVLLLCAPLFVTSAIEYRVDVLGNLGFIAALVVALRGRWIAFGALMSLAVLANMRLAPLVVFTAALLLVWKENRWRFNPRALWMAAGVAMVAIPFVAWLFFTRAWDPFLKEILGYNTAHAGLLGLNTFWDQFLGPVWLLDPAAIALWGAAIGGCVLALRVIRAPGEIQIVAIVFVASILAIAIMEVQYVYHFQTTYLLMVPLAALALERLQRWEWVALAVAAVALVINLLPLTSPSWGEPMRYQDYVMREVDRRTTPDDTVFDGTGYALRRKPAYRYWFLPYGLRFLAERGTVEPYDIAKDPPAAVIHNLRMQRWFEIFPRTAAYAVQHYVPVTRDLWLPGMTVALKPGASYQWTVPVAGRYTLHASEPLVRHPWFTKPLDLAKLQGPRATQYAIPLSQLPIARVEWRVDGRLVPHQTVSLRKGARVEVLSREDRPVGVLLVPAGIQTLAAAPAEEFQF
ncbi:MAG TPA: hypothetical protein VF432_13120 [Thermoanaerobaculia bacterium]